MADVKSGEGLRTPVRVAHQPGAAPNKPFYLDGCFMEEVDAIRIVGSPETGTQGGGYSTDNIDPTDLPTASGQKKKLIGTNGTASFVASDNRGLLRLDTTAAASSVSAARKDFGTGIFSLVNNTAAAGVTPNGKRAWYTTSVIYPTGDTIGDGRFICGLVPQAYAPTTTLTTPTDGLFFLKSAAGTTTDFIARKSSTSTTLTAVETLAGLTSVPALNTAVEYSFTIDVTGMITVFVNGFVAGTILGTDANVPFSTALTVIHGRDNNAAANSRKIDQDYELFCYEI